MTGSPGPATFRNYGTKTCTVDGCTAPHKGMGLCSTHYTRQKDFGDVHRAKQMPAREDHWKWAGDDISYGGVHSRLEYQRGKARTHTCRHCNGQAEQWAYDHDDPDEKIETERGLRYSPDLDHYIPLCVPCHKQFDRPAIKHDGGEAA